MNFLPSEVTKAIKPQKSVLITPKESTLPSEDRNQTQQVPPVYTAPDPFSFHPNNKNVQQKTQPTVRSVKDTIILL